MMRRYLASIASLAVAYGAHAANVSLEIPYFSPADPGLDPAARAISNFYQFTLMSGGILAFGTIVYGAIKYTASRGNPGQQQEARQWITQALLGLLLLIGAALILRTISPAFREGVGLPILNP